MIREVEKSYHLQFTHWGPKKSIGINSNLSLKAYEPGVMMTGYRVKILVELK